MKWLIQFRKKANHCLIKVQCFKKFHFENIAVALRKMNLNKGKREKRAPII